MTNQSKQRNADEAMPTVAQDEEEVKELAASEPAPAEDTDPLSILLSAEHERVTEDIIVPKRPGLKADLRLTIGSLTDRQFRDISTEAEEVVRAGGNRQSRRSGAGTTREVNPDKFLRLIVANGVVAPSFNHPQLLAKHQARTAEEVVQAILLPGEIARAAELIMDLSGFNDNTIEFAGN